MIGDVGAQLLRLYARFLSIRINRVNMNWKIFLKLLSLIFALSLLPLISVDLAWAESGIEYYFLYICLFYFIFLIIGLFVSAKIFKYLLVLIGISWIIVAIMKGLPSAHILFLLQALVGVVVLIGNLRDAVSGLPTAEKKNTSVVS